jgi:hypothetical protein
VFCLLFAGSAQAQDSPLGNWLIYFGNKKLPAKFDWHHEVQYRNYNALGDLEQLLLRTGIGYNLTENNNNLLLGYGFIHSQNYLDNGEKAATNEHRIYQQFITRQKIGPVAVQHRYRFEQRWIEQLFKVRFRYFLALNIPLYKVEDEEPKDRSFYLSLYNEIFIQTEGNAFDRNRSYAALGFRLNKYLRFELGYMNQFLPDFNRDQINVVIFANY